MTSSSAILYNFGPFRIDTQSQRLYRENTVIPLTRKRYEILLFLVSHAGTVIRKEDIFEAIWPNQTVEESNLTQHIYLLRRDIEDDPRSPIYIQTIPGEGYRFHPEVKAIHPTDLAQTGPITNRGGRVDNLPLGQPSEQSSAIGQSPAGELTGSLSSTPAGRGARSLFSTYSPTVSTILLLAIVFVSIVTVGGLLYYKYVRPVFDYANGSMPQITPIQTAPGVKSELAFSHDGRLLAYISETDKSKVPDIFVMVGNGGTPIQVTNSADGEHLFTWSPDNLELAFLRWSADRPSKYRLITIPALGGIEKEIAEVDGGVSWSPDGRFFAVVDSLTPNSPSGIVLLSVDGQRREPLSISNDVNIFDNRPRFSPDGTRVAFIRWRSSGNSDLHVVEISSRQTTQITFDSAAISDLQWTNDGKQIVFASNRSGNQRLWLVDAKGGKPVPLSKVPPDVRHFSISPGNSNHLVYVLSPIDTLTDIISVSHSSGNNGVTTAQRICRLNTSRADDSPRWSPNGEILAFCSGRSGFTEIWISRADCSELRQLTSLQEQNVGSPRWSPDSKEIVFDRVIEGQAEVFKVNVQSGEVVQMTSNPTSDKLPSYSANGQYIYFNSHRSGTPQIWKMATNGSGSTQVTVQGGFEPLESFDGKTLYYTRNHFLWKKDLVSGTESAVSELSSTPVHRYWDIGVNKIYYVPSTSSANNAIFCLDTLTGISRQLVLLDGVTHRELPGLSVSPQQDRIAISYIGYPFLDITLIENWR